MELDDPREVMLWPAEPPFPLSQPQPEQVEERPPLPERLGPNRAVTFVGSPTLTIHRPAEPNGVSVVICPGGGFRYLEIDKEGHVVARALVALGITALVLKYRTRPEASSPRRTPMDANVRRAIMADGRQAIRLARQRSLEWSLDMARIGIMGFSAGGVMAAVLATRWEDDGLAGGAAGTLSARPDFAAPIYPGIPDEVLHAVSSDTPPTFLAVADDDRQTPAENCLRFYAALRAAGVSTELHIFARARHGFGLGAPDTGAARWPQLFMAWLTDIGMVQRGPDISAPPTQVV